MMKSNFFIYSSGIILESLGKILYFPIWWYSSGLLRRAKSLFYFLRDRERDLGFMIWAKNMFVPMYGQSDFAGRMISFFVRLIQVIFRGIVLLFYSILSLVMFLLWLFFPLLILFLLIFQIF